MALAQIKQEKRNLARLKKELSAWNEVRELALHTAQVCQQQVHKQICEVVTACLDAVFSDPYQFRFRFENKRGRTEAIPEFVRDGLVISSLKQLGGGVVDVAAFALRLACIVSAQPAVRKVIIMDEPFKFVARKLQKKIAAMLEMLAKKLGVQIIMTTHEEDLEIGHVVNLSSQD